MAQSMVWLGIERERGFDRILQPCEIVKYEGSGLVTVEAMFGRRYTVPAEEIATAPQLEKPEVFYRYRKLPTGYQQWSGWVGPSWFRSTGSEYRIEKQHRYNSGVVSALETLWLARYPQYLIAG